MRGKRHSGVDIVIPPSKVCMPTRITCKLIKKEKVANLPALKEDEALASRILEVGPVGAKFVGQVISIQFMRHRMNILFDSEKKPLYVPDSCSGTETELSD